MKLPLYLDYAATTPLDERVLAEMYPYFSQHFGNASSRHHAYGWLATEAIEVARQKVAKALNCADQEVFFTSGATESINLAIRGFFKANPGKSHIISAKTEHKATLDTLDDLVKEGKQVSWLPVNAKGEMEVRELENLITEQTGLISLLWVNNETGVLSPIEGISNLAKKHGILLHCDATQAIGKVPVDFKTLGMDLLSGSAHKIYGPKGVGFLLIKKGVKIAPEITGGGHQRGLRSGTLNVPGIVGLGKAISIAKDEQVAESARIEGFNQRFCGFLAEHPSQVLINALGAVRVPHIVNVCFSGQDGEGLMQRLSHLAISNGSACNAATTQPSHVLKAMGYSDADAFASLRFSFGKPTTSADIETCIDQLKKHILV
jgi:cysteine desulfurase